LYKPAKEIGCTLTPPLTLSSMSGIVSEKLDEE
jgi:hypothetical protein